MTCFDTRATTSNTNTGTIVGLLRRIDKMQREAIIANTLSNCENCMISPMYNTKPIAIYCNCNRFTAEAGIGGPAATLFRVEEVRDSETVLLRLLVTNGTEVTCTNFTIVMRISCICSIQCYDPMNCEVTCSLAA